MPKSKAAEPPSGDEIENDIEDIREESRRRNAGDIAPGRAWGVAIPTLLAERDRLTAENAKLRETIEGARRDLHTCIRDRWDECLVERAYFKLQPRAKARPNESHDDPR